MPIGDVYEIRRRDGEPLQRASGSKGTTAPHTPVYAIQVAGAQLAIMDIADDEVVTRAPKTREVTCQ